MQQAVHTPCFLGMRSLIPDHQIWECKINLISSKNFRGYSGPQKKNFDKRLKPKFYNKNFTAPKFPDLQYVCMYVSVHYMKGLCMSYLEDGMYVCTCPMWRVVCICVCASYMVVVCLYTRISTYHSGTTPGRMHT